MGGGFEFKKRNQIQINSNGSKLLKTLTTQKMPCPSSKNIKKNMVLKLLKRWTTFSIETSSDSECILNEKSEKPLG
jgi:hypothetical protein